MSGRSQETSMVAVAGDQGLERLTTLPSTPHHLRSLYQTGVFDIQGDLFMSTRKRSLIQGSRDVSLVSFSPLSLVLLPQASYGDSPPCKWDGQCEVSLPFVSEFCLPPSLPPDQVQWSSLQGCPSLLIFPPGSSPPWGSKGRSPSLQCPKGSGC